MSPWKLRKLAEMGAPNLPCGSEMKGGWTSGTPAAMDFDRKASGGSTAVPVDYRRPAVGNGLPGAPAAAVGLVG